MKVYFSLLTIVLVSLSTAYAADLRGTTAFPQQETGPPEFLMRASGSYKDGLLQIEIPFSGDAAVGNYLGFGLTGVSWQTLQPGNPVGWISYYLDDGELLYSGPLDCLNALGTWIWYYDFMPTRVKVADPALSPIVRFGFPGLVIEGFNKLLDDTYPNGFLRIVIYGEVIGGLSGPQPSIRLYAPPSIYAVTIPVTLPHQLFVNYIAFGGFANLIVNQEIVATNLSEGICTLDIDLIDRDGVNAGQLNLDVPGDSTVRAPLIDLYMEQTQTADLPALWLGTALVTAMDGDEADQQCNIALGTVYQILQSSGAPSATAERETQSTIFLSEGGLAVPKPSCYNLVPVRKSSSGEDTGVALANPSETAVANLQMRLLDHEQKEIASVEGITLNQQVGDSKFFWEFFGDLADLKDFEGSLVIHSDVGIGVIAMNTLNGYVQSSLPSGISKP
jgi:hypothetical protein